MTWTLLHWKDVSSHEEASLGTPDDGAIQSSYLLHLLSPWTVSLAR